MSKQDFKFKIMAPCLSQTLQRSKRYSKVLHLLFLTFCSTLVFSQSLTVNLTNIGDGEGNGDGVIELQLYNIPQNFPEGEYLEAVRVKGEAGVLAHTFENLPIGIYAIVLYHDANNDEKCNLNFLGIPTEAYAFSKNIRPKFGAPDFSDCSVSVKVDESITIDMVY